MMRNRLSSFVLGGFLAMGVVGTAGAETLAFSGTLTFGVGTLPALTVPARGSATVNGSAGGLHVNSLALAGGTFGPVNASLPVTTSATIQSVRFTGLANASGSFSFPSGGQMGVNGLAKVCLVFDVTCINVNVPIPLTGGIGVGGNQVIPGAVSLTLQHNPWVATGGQTITIHDGMSVVTFGENIPQGFQHGPASGTSSTAQPLGVVQLVTVSRVFTSLTTAFPELPVFSVLNLRFVPEPGALPLFGAAVAGLVLIGWRRGRN